MEMLTKNRQSYHLVQRLEMAGNFKSLDPQSVSSCLWKSVSARKLNVLVGPAAYQENSNFA